MTTAEKIAVMQAFLDGKVIRLKEFPVTSHWHKDSFPEPSWDWDNNTYEVVPKPKQPVLREWKPEEVPLDAWYKRISKPQELGRISWIMNHGEIKIWISCVGIPQKISELKEYWLHSFTPFDANSWKECGVRE